MPINTSRELADVFYGTAQKHASDRGYELGDPLPTRFRQLAEQGANEIFARINRNNVDPYNPIIMRQITDAEYRSKQFIDLMIVNHRRRSGRANVLEDTDFQFSSSWLSPMWPFCN